jgi:hypothetical protein
MKTNNLPVLFHSRSYVCSLFGHRFQTTKKVNTHFNEYQCSFCHLQATNDNRGKKIKLTSKLKDINETLLYLHLKREFISKFYFKKNIGNKN